MRSCLLVLLAAALWGGWGSGLRADDPAANARGKAANAADRSIDFAREIQPIFKQHCLKCHGPKRSEAGLRLDVAAKALAGGDSGPAILPGKAAESRLFERVMGTSDDGRMPPEDEGPALPAESIARLRAWIDQGAKWPDEGPSADAAAKHWAFQPLRRPQAPKPPAGQPSRGAIDGFLSQKLASQKLTFAPEADRPTLIRRLYLDVLGLPPTPAEVEAFVRDQRGDAYERLVDRLLTSPHYGERMGRRWLDVVGYADSNGYHRADSPRPLAWRYRDYVIKSFNEDKPYDRLWLEQLAGDELVGRRDADRLSPEAIDCLVATHFLRNGPDGTDSTEGNEIARTIERYAVLEQQQQLTISAMFALTIDCARCHSHKFDPIPQSDYYALQAIFYPAFNVREWVQPKDRTTSVATSEELADWKRQLAAADAEIDALRREHQAWLREHREKGETLFGDDFQAALAPRWSNTAPEDDAPAEPAAVHVDSEKSPGALVKDGALRIIHTGGQAAGWLSSAQSFDWTPEEPQQWIQITFDLVDVKLDGQGAPAERIGFYIATRDYNDNGSVAGGNVLIDGDPAGGAQVYVDNPGPDARAVGKIGKSTYTPGRSYGVRVTNTGGGKYRLDHLVDGIGDAKGMTLKQQDLPDGGIGFEICCGRSFVVDNVLVERGGAKPGGPEDAAIREQFAKKRQEFEAALKTKQQQRPPKPGMIAWVTDLSPKPPEVHLLKRGSYFNPGQEVAPGALSALCGANEALEIKPPSADAATTGRRLALARWATRKDSRAAAQLARVQVNRLWMWRFGQGIVDTPENFGAKGSPPVNPELLEYLAAELVDHGWRMKQLDRQILLSHAYRQSSREEARALEVDPDGRSLWRYPPHRLESETIRDSMLAVAGTLHLTMGGPPVDYQKDGEGQIVVAAQKDVGAVAANRRTIYIRQRRSEPVTFMSVFDQATAEPNCLRRSTATVVSQSLALLNSEFAVSTAEAFAGRVEREAGETPQIRVTQAFRLALSREPSGNELDRVLAFLRSQEELQRDVGVADARQAQHRALANFCQMLLAANEFIYLQ